MKCDTRVHPTSVTTGPRRQTRYATTFSVLSFVYIFFKYGRNPLIKCDQLWEAAKDCRVSGIDWTLKNKIKCTDQPSALRDIPTNEYLIAFGRQTLIFMDTPRLRYNRLKRRGDRFTWLHYSAMKKKNDVYFGGEKNKKKKKKQQRLYSWLR